MITVKTLPRKQLSLWEKMYIPEIIRGLTITARHLIRNIFRMNDRMTLNYPEEKPVIPERHRSEHRLMTYPDGQVRCTACQLCATACPADCIEIIAEEADDKTKEKRPAIFNINTLRCIFCGFCVEACPCDAIRMDTKKIEASRSSREEFIYTKEYLVNNHPEGVSPVSIAIH